MKQALTPTMEDYMELIYNLGKNVKVVRVRDIARGMNVKMPSVTSMLKTLNKKNLIEHEKYEYVELTEEGLEVARESDLIGCNTSTNTARLAAQKICVYDI